MEAEKRKNRQNDDDQADEVNYSIHVRSPAESGTGYSPRQLHNSSAVPRFFMVHCSPKRLPARLVSTVMLFRFGCREHEEPGSQMISMVVRTNQARLRAVPEAPSRKALVDRSL